MKSIILLNKIVALTLVLLLSGCKVFKDGSSAQKVKTSEELKSELQIVVETLEKKPSWLFPADACPSDIIPSNEQKITYLSEVCKKNSTGCLENCEKGDGNACYSLALLLQDVKGREQQEAEALFLRSCKLGIVSGCTNRAAAKFNLEANNANAIECSIKTFEKTCEKDDPWGCTMLGFVLANGRGRSQDLNQALKVLSKSCKFGNEDEACLEAKKLQKQIEDFKKEKKK